MQLVLTVADHDHNGFIALAAWRGLKETHARDLLARIDALVSDEAEPDDKTASFTFVIDVTSPRHK